MFEFIEITNLKDGEVEILNANEYSVYELIAIVDFYENNKDYTLETK